MKPYPLALVMFILGLVAVWWDAFGLGVILIGMAAITAWLELLRR